MYIAVVDIPEMTVSIENDISFHPNVESTRLVRRMTMENELSFHPNVESTRVGQQHFDEQTENDDEEHVEELVNKCSLAKSRYAFK